MKGRWIWPVVGGFAGTGAIMALYLGLVTLTSGSWEHALSLLAEDRWFVGPIVLGFGIQAGLLVHLRRNLHARRGRAMAAASGGTSTAAMIACCAHHVTDVLPLLGLQTLVRRETSPPARDQCSDVRPSPANRRRGLAVR